MDEIARAGLPRAGRASWASASSSASRGCRSSCAGFGLTMGLKFDRRAGRRARGKAADRRGRVRGLRRARPLGHPVQAAADRHRGGGRRDRRRRCAARWRDARGAGRALRRASCARSTTWSRARSRPATRRGCRCSGTARSHSCSAGRRTARGSPASECRRSDSRAAVRRLSAHPRGLPRGPSRRGYPGGRDRAARQSRGGRRRRRLRGPARAPGRSSSRPRSCAARTPAAGHPLVEARGHNRGGRRQAAASASTRSSPTGPGTESGSPTSTSRPRCSGPRMGDPLLDLGAARPGLSRDPARPLRRFVAPRILDGYRDLREVYLDLAGNLIKERLDPWLPRLPRRAQPDGSPSRSTETEVRRYYRSDARLWAALLAIRRLDRAWHRRVRRRPVPVPAARGDRALTPAASLDRPRPRPLVIPPR